MKKLRTVTGILLTFIFISYSFSFAQERIKIVTYNLLNYPNNTAQKNPEFSLILEAINPDIVVVQEITSQSAVNLFLSAVLGSEYQAGTFINGFDTDNAIFFKDSLIAFISNIPIDTPLRDISQFTVYNKITQDTIIIYSAHFKAGNDPSDETQRFGEANILRIHTDALSPETNFILVGDLNLYRSTEAAYEKLLNQNGNGYFLDPINSPGDWHNNLNFAGIHTQSTRLPGLPDGGSSGGLDDRFDFMLVSQSIIEEGGIDYVPGTYWAYGNDGDHFNQSINSPENNSVSPAIANALFDASDHLPVVAEFNFGVVSDVEDEIDSPKGFALYQNYPNPFNPGTKIKFTIPDLRFTILKVYDVLGNEVTTLVNKELSAGTYEVQFDASKLPSGIYMYRLTVGSHSLSKKMILLK